LTAKPELLDHVTPAALFRMIDKRPTTLIAG
jgi:hypothetical protein